MILQGKNETSDEIVGPIFKSIGLIALESLLPYIIVGTLLIVLIKKR